MVYDYLQVVNRYIDEGVAELVPGVLFIDEVRFLIPPCLWLIRSDLTFLIRKTLGSYAWYGVLFLLKPCSGELLISNSDICNK